MSSAMQEHPLPIAAPGKPEREANGTAGFYMSTGIMSVLLTASQAPSTITCPPFLTITLL